MKYILSVIAFLFVLLISTNSFAYDAKVMGFLALDLATVKQVTNEHTAIATGIGVLDLKVIGEQDNISVKFKLDLDDSSLSKPFNLFEEATATYRFDDQFRLTAGKGVVPFHHMHWGVLENSYIDGGSALPYDPGSDLYWKDIDNKVILSLNFRDAAKRFNEYFTFWGYSNELAKNDDGSKKVDSAGKPIYDNSKTFNTQEQWGLANKFEFYPMKGLELSFGAVGYQHDLNPDFSYAFDVGAGYENRTLEIWYESMYGRSSEYRYAQAYKSGAITNNSSYFKKFEQNHQVGAEFFGTELINYLVSAEYKRTTSSLWVNSAEVKYQAAKLDTGVKFKLAQKAFITTGLMFEKLWKEQNTVAGGSFSKTKINALEFKTGLSVWF